MILLASRDGKTKLNLLKCRMMTLGKERMSGRFEVTKNEKSKLFETSDEAMEYFINIK